MKAQAPVLWKRLDFDTERLECSVARIDSSVSLEQLQQALGELEQASVALAYYTTSRTQEELALPWFEGVRVDGRAVYELRCRDPAPISPPPAAYTLRSIPSHLKPSDELVDLALEAGRWSRFNRDPSLTRAQFERMFRMWIKNIVARRQADEVFGIYDKSTDKIVAFVSIKKKSLTHASIGLIAVDAQHRRKGLASVLMQRTLLWAAENSVEVEVVTQEVNADARGFYEKFGFTLKEVSSDYHIWLPVKGMVRANVPYVTYREKLNFKQMFRSKAIESLGPFTVQAQKWIADTVGSKCVLLSGSATAALDHAAIVCGIGHGDEVILPSYTFVSTANCFVLRGATPVFVDSRQDTLNIDETKIEAAITPNTKVICVVHYAGLPCEMDVIMDIAKRHNLIVIEDAAQGFLTKYKGRPLGSIGHLACFSFHYTKNVIAGEGGALCINDERFVHRAHIVWEKGTNRFDFLQGKVDKYCWVDIG
jgi:ribosomal protein S18 acetylase RimI-like enzyme